MQTPPETRTNVERERERERIASLKNFNSKRHISFGRNLFTPTQVFSWNPSYKKIIIAVAKSVRLNFLLHIVLKIHAHPDFLGCMSDSIFCFFKNKMRFIYSPLNFIV